MKLSLLQMNMALGRPEENFRAAEQLILQAAQRNPDVLVLPETWNTGFFPREQLADLSDRDCEQVRLRIGALAAQLGVNIVAGSVSNVRNGRVYNTACVFDRTGACIAQYDKAHLFTPMGEQDYYTPGASLCRFTLDGVPCGLIICYDVRFPEYIRTLALQGIQLLFVVSQWPKVRTAHLRALTTARAIENQMFVACCNSCGTAGDTVYGGASAVIDPWGQTLALAGETQQILPTELDFSVVEQIRSAINVFRDRRPELYEIK
ncbi:MAG: carbon-nitrogen family hydrolase [Clostridia bacterium]|nr:carbon-nitrogen family hydrolase [Clostridia bacterium]